MYIKDKERVFSNVYRCIPGIVFREISLKLISIRKRISYDENNLIQYMNIMNGRITKRMIMYD